MTDIIIKHGIELAMGLIVSALTLGFRHIVKKQKSADIEQRAIANGVKALIRNCIIQSCDMYRDMGYCSVCALENIEALSKEYKALGGNGTITTLVQEMHALPREIPKTDDQ